MIPNRRRVVATCRTEAKKVGVHLRGDRKDVGVSVEARRPGVMTAKRSILKGVVAPNLEKANENNIGQSKHGTRKPNGKRI